MKSAQVGSLLHCLRLAVLLATLAPRSTATASAATAAPCSSSPSFSSSAAASAAAMRVTIVPVLEDNFSYIITDEDTKQSAVVDPAQPDRVLHKAQQEGLTISAIITTHHHLDHAGGNEEFVRRVPGITVYGGDDRVKALTHFVKDGEEFNIGNLRVKSFYTHCHTSGSVSFLVYGNGDQPDAIFTGDTLFVAGCGRFFEGSADQMVHNMAKVYATLKPNTLVYPGHEYTIANLRFAASVEPANKAIQEKLLWSEKQRSQGLHTVPSTIAEEFTFNPFMRLREPTIQEATKSTDLVEVMKTLREMKNNFK